MATVQEQITDQHLRDVFNDIKGIDGKHRSYINFEDFKRACIQYKPDCLKQLILDSTSAPSALEELNAEIEEHFRNICESCSPTFDNKEAQKMGHASPRPAAPGGDDGEDLIDDLGNMSIDEGTQAQEIRSKPIKKKLKQKPTPHYLTGTAASRGQQRPKSPFTKTNTNVKAAGGINAIPNSTIKRSPTSPMSKTTAAQGSASSLTTSTQWIEDIPLSEMKIFFDNFRATQAEFLALAELTKEILAAMGIILRALKNDRRNGVNKSHFNEFDDDEEEQEMQEEGVYTSQNGPDILTMQNLDESVGPGHENEDRAVRNKVGTPFDSADQEHTTGKRLGQEQGGDLHFGTENKKWKDIDGIDDEDAQNMDLKYATVRPQKKDIVHKPQSILSQPKSGAGSEQDILVDVANLGSQENLPAPPDARQSVRMQAYGQEKQDSMGLQNKRGYQYNDDDQVLTSADMTIMSGKGLNITGMQTKRNNKGKDSNKNTEVEDYRLDTQEEEFDIDAIDQAHQKQEDDEKKQATGMSHNIFDVSSYGEVRLNNFQKQSYQGKPPATQQDHSVSLVQMDGSLQFDDIKAFKKGQQLHSQPILEEASPHDSQLTGNFDMSQDSKKIGQVNDSRSHYMDPQSPGHQQKQTTDTNAAAGQNHYTQMMEQPGQTRAGSISKKNRSSNRSSKKIMAPENNASCCQGCQIF